MYEPLRCLEIIGLYREHYYRSVTVAQCYRAEYDISLDSFSHCLSHNNNNNQLCWTSVFLFLFFLMCYAVNTQGCTSTAPLPHNPALHLYASIYYPGFWLHHRRSIC